MEEESSNVLPKAITMTICLSDAGKRFNRDWIFRHVNYTFEAGQSYAITGPNGSGKSTLLQVLSGGMMINEGVIEFEVRSQESGLPSVALAKEGVRLALRSFSEGGSQEFSVWIQEAINNYFNREYLSTGFHLCSLFRSSGRNDRTGVFRFSQGI